MLGLGSSCRPEQLPPPVVTMDLLCWNSLPRTCAGMAHVWHANVSLNVVTQFLDPGGLKFTPVRLKSQLEL